MSQKGWPHIVLRVPPEMKLAVENYAAQNGTSVSTVIRFLLSRFLEAGGGPSADMVAEQAAYNRAIMRIRGVVGRAIEQALRGLG